MFVSTFTPMLGLTFSIAIVGHTTTLALKKFVVGCFGFPTGGTTTHFARFHDECHVTVQNTITGGHCRCWCAGSPSATTLHFSVVLKTSKQYAGGKATNQQLNANDDG